MNRLTATQKNSRVDVEHAARCDANSGGERVARCCVTGKFTFARRAPRRNSHLICPVKQVLSASCSGSRLNEAWQEPDKSVSEKCEMLTARILVLDPDGHPLDGATVTQQGLLSNAAPNALSKWIPIQFLPESCFRRSRSCCSCPVSSASRIAARRLMRAVR